LIVAHSAASDPIGLPAACATRRLAGIAAGARISLWRAGYDARRTWVFDVLFAGAGVL
jgi:hypothetical protein